jgi:alcohol dehydrogenase YqhD (iron-dependent ADH family)
MLEEAAINVTGVPIELIQNRQSPDYAMQLTMSSSKFLRFVYNRQTIFQKQMSKLYTKIYDLEYGSTDKLQLILPPPLFINMTNTNQLIQNATEYAENVIESFIPNEDDEVKAEAKSQLKRYNLSQYVDSNLIDVIIDKAKHQIALKKLTLGDNNEE